MKKLLSTAVALGVMASITPIAFADVAVNALPTLDSVKNGSVTTTGNNMNVKIEAGQGGVGTFNWKNFNVGKDAKVNYEFSAHNQTALNKVSASGGISQIYGKITASGCQNCGYEGTGKVILLNPNGVLFGDGANVNLNSFTVSNMNGTFDETANKLTLTKNSNTSDFGIVVQKGATIHGDKAVNFAANNVALYNGSKISTNVAPNYGTDSFGKVKIVTSDGVNFNYYQNGAVKGIDGLKTSADKMMINMNGEIISGNIDVRNTSTNVASEINLNGATLKATKAVTGNDGNIWLTAHNNVIIDNSKLETVDYSANAAAREGGNIRVLAGKKVSVGNSDLDAVGNIDLISQGYDVVAANTTIDTAKDVNLTAANIASIQGKSNVNAKNVTVNGGKRAQVTNSTVTAKEDINLISKGDMVWTNNANLKAGRDINAEATNGYLYLTDSIMNADRNVNLKSKDTVSSANLKGTTFTAGKDVNVESTGNSVILTSTSQFQPKGTLNLTAAKNVEINSAPSLTTENTNIKAGENVFLTSSEGSVTVKDTTKFVEAKKIYITGKTDVVTSGQVDLNNIQTNIKAGNNVNADLLNVGNRQNGLIAEAGNDMTITTPGTLSVSSLISGKDMTINANKVIAGLPYTDKTKLPDDLVSERSYIEVGGEFTSNVKTDNYDITASGELTNDGKYNQKHHIQYTEDEKILLVNKRPVDNKVTDPTLPGINGGDDVDVVNPGSNPGTTEPTNPSNPGQGGGDNPGQGGDNPGQGGGDNPGQGGGDNPGQGGDNEPCPDVPNGDKVEDEDTPELLSLNNVLNSALINRNNK